MPSRPLHALLLPGGPQLLDALAAAIDGGPALLPLDPNAPAAGRARQLDLLRPHALVDAEGVHRLPAAADLDEDVAVVIGTSGSTGTPKAVQLSADALLHSARATLSRLDAQPGQRWLCCLPTHHIAGIQVLVRSLVAASAPEITQFDPRRLGETSADFVSLVPTMLFRALEAGVDLTGFRAILVGGAATTPELVQRAAEAGARVVTTYGMTETGGGAVYDGVPLDGVRVSVGPGGRIRLGGPVLAGGYRLDPELTAAAFADGWHVTQDAGRLTADGRLQVLGRLDDVIITGGVNVSLQEVARALSAHPAVAQAAAYARPDREWGQSVVAVVVPREPAPSLGELRAFVADAAGVAAAPRELVLTAELPTLPGGKLDRCAIRRLPGRAKEPDADPARASPHEVREMRPSAAGRASPHDVRESRPYASPGQHWPRRRAGGKTIWLEGARPRTLPAAVTPVVVGSGVALGDGQTRWGAAVLALVVALALQVGVNYANDYSDGVRGTDSQRVGPFRLVGSGAASPSAVRRAAFAAFGVAAVAGLVLASLTSWWLIAVGAACISAAWTYTGGSRPYGYRALGELSVFVFFGLVAVVGTYFVHSGQITRVSVAAAVPVGMLACALLVVNNLRDVPTDAAAGKRTLAVVLGDRRTRVLGAILLVAPFAVAVLLTLTRPWAWLPLLALPLAIAPLRQVRSGAAGRDLISTLRDTGRLQLGFGLLFAVGLGLG